LKHDTHGNVGGSGAFAHRRFMSFSMTRVSANSTVAAIAAGAIGGLLGAWFKLGWEVTCPPRAPDRIPEPMVLVSMFTHVPTPVWASLIIHFVFSILCGVAYGLLVEFFPIVAIGAGVGFGLAIWIGAHEVVMPLMGLTPPTWQLPANEQGSEFFGHAIWGLVIGVFFSFFHDLMVKPVRMTALEGTDLVPIAERIDVY
jgi:putative membrane protein